MDWGFVLEANNIEDAVTSLETKILELMNACTPLRIVKMSPRDPFWMSPLIKYLLQIKAKGTGSHKDLLKRISKAIMDNRVRLNSANGIGSREWWKITNAIYSYEASTRCTLSEAEIKDLNCFFAQLCTDNDYHKPEPISVPSDAEIPRVKEMQVWRALLGLKKRVTGPDQIPFWI